MRNVKLKVVAVSVDPRCWASLKLVAEKFNTSASSVARQAFADVITKARQERLTLAKEFQQDGREIAAAKCQYDSHGARIPLARE
jgi:hypothetical protein